jgi:SAM-dependent methyltransferase
MNRIHQRLCSSDGWARRVREELVPWALKGVDLGPDVLEIGPGYGPTTKVLAERVPRITALEADARLAVRLAGELDSAPVVAGDGAAMPFGDEKYSSVVCFTMLHHVHSGQRQDRLFGEVHRVLRPGGTFAGSDSLLSLRFRLLHLFDTMVVVDPDTDRRASITRSSRARLAPEVWAASGRTGRRSSRCR